MNDPDRPRGRIAGPEAGSFTSWVPLLRCWEPRCQGRHRAPPIARRCRERNHQGLDNLLIAGSPANDLAGRVRRRSRLGGLLNFYERAA